MPHNGCSCSPGVAAWRPVPEEEPHAARFPFPLPNGWFMVAWSDELAPGEVRPLRYFAEDLVLFRTQDGQRTCSTPTARTWARTSVPAAGSSATRCAVPSTAGASTARPLRRGALRHANPADGAAARLADDRAQPDRLGLAPRRRARRPSWEVPLIPEAESHDWSGFDRYRWRIRYPQPGDGRERRRSRPLPLRARHHDGARVRDHGGRHLPPLAPAGPDADTAWAGRRQHRRPELRTGLRLHALQRHLRDGPDRRHDPDRRGALRRPLFVHAAQAWTVRIPRAAWLRR